MTDTDARFPSRSSTASGLRLVVFSRASVLQRFREIFDPMRETLDIVHLTDAEARGSISVSKAFYAAMESGTKVDTLSAEQVDDIVLRCRTLRGVGPERARPMLHAMYHALAAEIERLAPDCIASQMVDEYVSHLVALIAKQRGIGYFGFCAGYFPGTSLLLADAYGRPLRWRSVPREEAAAALESVLPRNFRQDYNLKSEYSLVRHVKAVARYKAKALIHSVAKHVRRDPLNLHYLQTPFIAERRNLRDYPGASLFSGDWQTELDTLRSRFPRRPIVYMPLSYFPEATIDYWVEDTRAISYEDLILDIISRLEERHIVLVKEHIHMMGARSAAFLRKINERANTVSVHPLEISNIVVEQADAVLLGSGSPGIEAALRGVPVISFCENGYWFEPAGASAFDIDRPESWNMAVSQAIAHYRPVDRDRMVTLVAACMEASTRTLPSSNPWPSLEPTDVVDLVQHLARRELVPPSERNHVTTDASH